MNKVYIKWINLEAVITTYNDFDVPFEIYYFGEKMVLKKDMNDTFESFKKSLCLFIDSINSNTNHISRNETLEIIEIIESEIMNRKILLTGGTGLIGLNLVGSLVDHGNEVTLVTSEKKLFELLKANNINIDFLSVIECDLLANDAKNIIVDETSKEIDSIVFC